MSRELRVGLMFALSLAILITALYFLGSFQKSLTYRIKFDKVGGLAKDSPVQFNGVPIGRVTQIVLSDEFTGGNQVPIIVTIAVHRSARNHIRTSTRADIRSVGVLGDKMILLITPDYAVDALEEDGFIATVPKTLDVDKLLEQGGDMVADVAVITKDLKQLLDKLANQDGSLQRLIGDEEMADDLKGSVAALRNLLNNDDSIAALVFQDPAFASGIRDSLQTTLANLEALSTTYREGDGLLPMLMSDEAFKAEVQGKIIKLLDSATTYMTAMTESKGLLYRLTQDEAYGQRVAENIDKSSAHLASILEKIDEGEGTASLIINDPALYQGLYEVVYGLQHSGLSKWYIQRKQKKGARLKADQNEDN